VGLRETKKARLRAQLYETAMQLFAERGYEATRIRDIIDRVGVSEATFFNYFPTKQALLDESAAEAKAYYNAYLRHLVARSEEPAADRVRELVTVVGSVFAAQQPLMASVVGTTSLFFGATGPSRDLDIENFELFAEVFRQGQVTGEIDPSRDALQLAEIVSAVQILTITNWASDWWGDIGPLAPRLAAAVEVILGGCTIADGAH
jgi:TetR/AcrR family transcriptional regulator, cholesterol catabolism regulator